MALENGDVERLRQVERRVDEIVPIIAKVAQLDGDVRVLASELKAAVRTLGRIEGSMKEGLDDIRTDLQQSEAQREDTEREKRSLSATERVAVWSVAGALGTAIILALAQLISAGVIG